MNSKLEHLFLLPTFPPSFPPSLPHFLALPPSLFGNSFACSLPPSLLPSLPPYLSTYLQLILNGCGAQKLQIVLDLVHHRVDLVVLRVGGREGGGEGGREGESPLRFVHHHFKEEEETGTGERGRRQTRSLRGPEAEREGGREGGRGRTLPDFLNSI